MILKKFYIVLIFLLYSTFLQSVQRPYPHLQSAIIKWWNTLPLHTTLTYFNVSDRDRYALDTAFDFFKKNAYEFPENIVATTLDLLSAKSLANEFILETSFKNPGGSKEKFYSLMKHHKPSQKNPWYLILKIDPRSIEMHNNLMQQWFAAFEQSSLGYLPHITVGKITAIDDLEIFVNTIEKVNTVLSKESSVALRIDTNHFLLKYPKKISKNNNRNKPILMLAIFNNDPVAERAIQAVELFSQAEQDLFSTHQKFWLFEKINTFFEHITHYFQSFKLYVSELIGA